MHEVSATGGIALVVSLTTILHKVLATRGISQG